jgi:hypothetical protein
VEYLHPTLKIGYGPRRLCGQIPEVLAVRKGMLMRRQSYVTSYFYEHSYNSVQLQPRDTIVCDTIAPHMILVLCSILEIEVDSAA